MDWKKLLAQVAAIGTSLARSFALGMVVLIMDSGWGVAEVAQNYEKIADAGLAAFLLTAYLFLDKGFPAYGVGSGGVMTKVDLMERIK